MKTVQSRLPDFKGSSDEEIIRRLSHMRFKTKQDDKNYDEDKQKVVYRIFEFKNLQQLKLKHFIRFFKTLWRFINYDANINNLLSY